jgi:hypothetical protein
VLLVGREELRQLKPETGGVLPAMRPPCARSSGRAMLDVLGAFQAVDDRALGPAVPLARRGEVLQRVRHLVQVLRPFLELGHVLERHGLDLRVAPVAVGP